MNVDHEMSTIVALTRLAMDGDMEAVAAIIAALPLGQLQLLLAAAVGTLAGDIAACPNPDAVLQAMGIAAAELNL